MSGIPLLIGEWRESLHVHDRIAAFDFDGTLAGVNGSYIYPKHGDDWKWIHPSVPKVIAHLHLKGWRIIIMSNQNGILKDDAKSAKRKAAFIGRIDNVIHALEKETGLEIPVRIYAATADDICRKPRPGMWQSCLEDLSHCNVDLSKSFYVGDAAGRPHEWVSGHTQEHLFHDKAFEEDCLHPLLEMNVAELPMIPIPWFHPETHSSAKEQDSSIGLREIDIPKHQEMIVFVGPPGSGKTFLYRKLFSDDRFLHINQDTLGTKAKCLKMAAEGLAAGKSVIIDNTNADKSTRRDYVKLAKESSVPVRCFHFDIQKEICSHNNAFREFFSDEKKRVPGIAYRAFYSRYEPPEVDEGFEDVVKIDWIPQFESEEVKQAWSLFYL